MESNWHNLKIKQVAEFLNTDVKMGLDIKEIRFRQDNFGENVLPKEKPLSRLSIFLSQFKSPLVYILVIAGTITLFLKEFTDSIVIFAAIGINTLVGYIQENKACNSLRKLKEILTNNAIVLRQGRTIQILQEQLVPGDIVILKTGSKVPADGRIIQALNLKINEAVLTGEWLAAEKNTDVLDKKVVMADRDNMAYMGTIVENGEGIMIVTETGQSTELGKIAGMIRQTKESKTPYQKKLSSFSKIIGLLISIVCLIIFIIGIVSGRDFSEMFTTAVAIAVAAIPEGLPVAMTVILALGMQNILKKKGLVRKLSSAETLGNTSIIATDKTLTLTEGKMQVTEIKAKDEQLALKIAVLCNEGFIENPHDLRPLWRIRGRPTDVALIQAGEKGGMIKNDLEKELPLIDELPFNSEDKFIATLHKGGMLFVSGAPEKIIDLSKGDDKQKLFDQLNSLTRKGLRVVAVGYKRDGSLEEINDLTFAGFIALKDPLRKDVKQAISVCRKAGMKPIIVTGDHMLTAKAVAEELGMKTKAENIIEGKELDNLNDEELGRRLNRINVFARVEPRHKLRIIQAWQEKNQVIAMTGDGINDAPALKKADIGVALGSGTDVAKEVSDLVLLNDSFSIIITAIEQGRAILDNIRKVITYLLSDSFTEIILIGVSLVAGMPLPLTAVQILWVNLIEDGLPSMALAFEPKEKDLMKMKPQNHKIPLLTKEMKTIIFIIGILTDLVLLGMFFMLFGRFGEQNMAYIRTMIFVALSIDSLFYVFSCKSLRKNIWQIDILSNKLLLISWIVGIIALFAASYISPLQALLGTIALAFSDWVILMGLGFIKMMLIEIAKHYFIVRKQTNL